MFHRECAPWQRRPRNWLFSGVLLKSADSDAAAVIDLFSFRSIKATLFCRHSCICAQRRQDERPGSRQLKKIFSFNSDFQFSDFFENAFFSKFFCRSWVFHWALTNGKISVTALAAAWMPFRFQQRSKSYFLKFCRIYVQTFPILLEPPHNNLAESKWFIAHVFSRRVFWSNFRVFFSGQ